MPNWCFNSMEVTGNGGDILKFIKDNFEVYDKKYQYTFNKIKPTPLDKNGEVIEGWYEWRMSNWGTKWIPDVFGQRFEYRTVGDDPLNVLDDHDKDFGKVSDGIYDIEKDIDLEDDARLYITFNTAWCPPSKLYEYYSTIYKETSLVIDVTYHEGGCGFAGDAKISKGEIEEKYVDCIKPIDYYEYIIENDLESICYLLELIFESIANDHEDKTPEFRNRLFEEISKIMYNDDVPAKAKATMFVDCTMKNRGGCDA